MWLLLLFLGVCLGILYLVTHRKKNDSSELTETQIRWREMLQEREKIRKTQTTSHYLNENLHIIERQREITEYIQAHRRPFYVYYWILEPLDLRMLREYILKLVMIGFLVLFYSSILPLWLMASTTLAVILIFDWYMYNKKLLLEVTEWNPEFHQKFIKNR